MVREFLKSDNQIEEMCFKSIKYSLEIAVVPIRKILIVFYVYLRLLFGQKPGMIEKYLTFL